MIFGWYGAHAVLYESITSNFLARELSLSLNSLDELFETFLSVDSSFFYHKRFRKLSEFLWSLGLLCQTNDFEFKLARGSYCYFCSFLSD